MPRVRAADFEIGGVDNKELATWISKNTTFDQLILEFYNEGDPNSGWVHCSAVKGEPRKQVLRASKVGRTDEIRTDTSFLNPFTNIFPP